MRAEDTLQFMADFYPRIFPTRKRAIHYLFCIVGNGYKWLHGELVDKDDDKKNRYLLQQPTEKAKFQHGDNWPDSYFDMPDIAWSEAIRHNGYARIFTYPHNIKDDWRGLI